MLLSVIIVNYNVKYFLEQCIYSVLKSIDAGGIAGEIIVVDNASADGSAAFIKEKIPQVLLLENEKNCGFAAANNLALPHCKGQYILYLNPDTILGENVLHKAIQFLQTHADAGAVGVRMVDGAGVFLPESKRSFPSPLVSFFKLSGLSALFPKSGFFNRYAQGNIDEKEVYATEVLCGAFIMSPANLLRQLSGFDTSFFMYGEDIDLCYRIAQTGKRNYYLGNLSIVHFKGESSRKTGIKHNKNFYTAMGIFVKKHYKGFKNVWLRFFLYAGIAIKYLTGFLGMLFTKNGRDKGLSTTRKCVIAGDEKGASEAEPILKRSPLLPQHFETVFENSLMEPATAADIIVFCTGDLSNEESINYISSHTGKRYFFHATGSSSIVGSMHKSSTGNCFS